MQPPNTHFAAFLVLVFLSSIPALGEPAPACQWQCPLPSSSNPLSQLASPQLEWTYHEPPPSLLVPKGEGRSPRPLKHDIPGQTLPNPNPMPVSSPALGVGSGRLTDLSAREWEWKAQARGLELDIEEMVSSDGQRCTIVGYPIEL